MKIPILKTNDSERFKECVLAYGHFNSVHPGHIRYLRHASKQGKDLVVAVIADELDGKKRGFEFNQDERAEGLAALDFIDGIILLESQQFSFLKAVEYINPSVLVLGKEFEESKDNEIKSVIKYLNKTGKNIQFHAGDIQYATTNLLVNSESDLIEDNRNEFKKSCKRQNITLEKLILSMEAWKKSRLLVIGDTIVDQYACLRSYWNECGSSSDSSKRIAKQEFHRWRCRGCFSHKCIRCKM